MKLPACHNLGTTPAPVENGHAGTQAPYRIVHAANYQLAKDGLAFFNPDHKIHQGLVQTGCYVYPFSINDRARMLSLTRSKNWGKGKANQAILRTCMHVHPDLLVLGHGQYITRKTLLAIRHELPDIRIAFWYFDSIWEGSHIEHLHARADLFDAIFCTTGGKLLQQFCRPGCPAALIPNPVDPAIECYRAFENPRPRYDFTFIGTDRKVPVRREVLTRLLKTLPEFRFGIFGSLGEPPVFGYAKEKILAESRMALNLNRKQDVELYSSDRIAQLTGNGILTLTPTGAGLEQLYTPDEVAYYTDLDDLIVKAQYYRAHDRQRVEVARNGWRKSHQSYSAKQVAQFILDLTFRKPGWQEAPWSRHIYWQDDS